MTSIKMLRIATVWTLGLSIALLTGCGGGGGSDSTGTPPPASAVLSIAPATLPPPSIGVGYSGALFASGGAPPYTYSVASGALPDGLFLDPLSGQISGTPASAGNFGATFRAVALDGNFGERSYTFLVVRPVVISTSTLAAGEEQVAYSQSVTATGGVGPYTWSVASGALPAGLSLSPSTGLTVQIAGVPSAPISSAAFTLRAQDGQGRSAQKALTISIANTYRVFFTADLESNGVNELYRVTLDDNLVPRAPVKLSGTVNPSDGDVALTFALSPDGKRIAYLADAGFDAVAELFVVDLSSGTPGPARKVNSTFTAPTGGKVMSFKWSPDSKKIAWHAEAFVALEYHMFFADVTGDTITQRQANPPTTVVLQRTVGAVGVGSANLDEDYDWSFDSRYLAFEADTVSRGNTSRTNPRIPDAFVCDTTTPIGLTPTATKVNLTAVNTAGTTSWLQWAPGKNVLVYADNVAGTVAINGAIPTEVYSVAISGSVAATAPSLVAQRPAILDTARTSPGFGSGCDFSPDGSKLALRYVPPGNNNFVDPYALYVAPVTSGGLGTSLAVTLTASGGTGSIGGYAWSPDSRQLLVAGLLLTSAVQTQAATCDVSGAVPGPLVPIPVSAKQFLNTSPYSAYAFTPDSTSFAYVNQTVNPNYSDLNFLRVSAQPATVSMQISGTINAIGGVVGLLQFEPTLFFSPDSQQVAYLSEQEVDNRVDLYASDISGTFPSLAERISPLPTSLTGDVQGAYPNSAPWTTLRPLTTTLGLPQWSSDSRFLLFRGDVTVDERYDLMLWDSTQVGAPTVSQVVPSLASRPGALGVTGYKLVD